ncbi:hypothetical protein PS710_03224 [Pseudomonas fluorescens]|uniref:Uncharacterized protein n=1 Tax=Pseudomonas fluorescens TaxID=294 RepID=A0A5E7CSS1_PSEFL|nr:hypothetical protein PS710_03224 [Pseudomonas fluorescens]
MRALLPEGHGGELAGREIDAARQWQRSGKLSEAMNHGGTRFAQHSQAEKQDQTGILGHLDEVIGIDQFCRGLLPAHQGFHADNLVTLQSDSGGKSPLGDAVVRTIQPLGDAESAFGRCRGHRPAWLPGGRVQSATSSGARRSRDAWRVAPAGQSRCSRPPAPRRVPSFSRTARKVASRRQRGIW